MDTIDLLQNNTQELLEYVESTNDTEFANEDLVKIIESSRDPGEGPFTAEEIMERAQAMAQAVLNEQDESHK